MIAVWLCGLDVWSGNAGWAIVEAATPHAPTAEQPTRTAGAGMPGVADEISECASVATAKKMDGSVMLRETATQVSVHPHSQAPGMGGSMEETEGIDHVLPVHTRRGLAECYEDENDVYCSSASRSDGDGDGGGDGDGVQVVSRAHSAVLIPSSADRKVLHATCVPCVVRTGRSRTLRTTGTAEYVSRLMAGV